MADKNLSFQLISENSCSNEVYMEFESQAHAGLTHSISAGKYTKASGLYSGMPFWIQSNGTYMLWFAKGQWRIGKESYLGTTTSNLHSTNSPPCPESIGSNWKYLDDGEWLDAQGNAKMYKFEGMIDV